MTDVLLGESASTLGRRLHQCSRGGFLASARARESLVLPLGSMFDGMLWNTDGVHRNFKASLRLASTRNSLSQVLVFVQDGSPRYVTYSCGFVEQ